MRRRGSPSNRVRALVNFMISLYGEEELADLSRHVAEEARSLDAGCCSEHYLFIESLLQSANRELRRKILDNILPDFIEAPGSPVAFRDLFLQTDAHSRTYPASPMVREVHEEQEPSPTPEQVEAFRMVESAMELFESGDRAGAGDLFDAALSLDRKCFPAYLGIIISWVNLPERVNQLERHVQEATRLFPKKSVFWWVLGRIFHVNLLRFGDAEYAYRKAIETGLPHAWAWTDLGRLLHEEFGRYDEAEYACRKAMEMDPGDTDAWIQLGRLLHRVLGRHDESEHAYRKAIEVDSTNHRAWGLLAELLLTLGRFHEVRDMVEVFLANHPTDAGVRNALAWSVYESRIATYLDRAETWARDAAVNAPEDAAVQHTYACVLCANGKAHDAMVPSEKYFSDAERVEKSADDAIELGVALAAADLAKEALTLIQRSPSAKFLEPLIVGLRVALGEDVKAAAEILEVGKDVAERIQQRIEAKHAAQECEVH